MNLMHAFYAACVVLLLTLLGLVAHTIPGGVTLLTVVLPYVALLVLLVGICYRVSLWASSPVPFRIPTTCGQQRSLPWIRTAPLDNPSTGLGAVGRVALEVLAFRSLLRNNHPRFNQGRLSFAETRVLWLVALAFHWSLLLVVLRHLRFAFESTPGFVLLLNSFDGMLQIGAPSLFLTDIVLIAALACLLLRRFWNPVLRYLSVFSDYFALFLLLSIAISGVLMRYVTQVDVISVKQFALGLLTFHPVTLAESSPVFLVHLLLVSTLAIYIPFSKLMHFGGVFLSPTRNLANNSRSKRHINPWNQPVHTHPYAEWELEFEGKLKLAGYELEKADHVGHSAED